MDIESTHFVAHIRPGPEGSPAEHLLDDHLRMVASKAAEFARQFGAEDWAHGAGIHHDLGKYRHASVPRNGHCLQVMV